MFEMSNALMFTFGLPKLLGRATCHACTKHLSKIELLYWIEMSWFAQLIRLCIKPFFGRTENKRPLVRRSCRAIFHRNTAAKFAHKSPSTNIRAFYQNHHNFILCLALIKLPGYNSSSTPWCRGLSRWSVAGHYRCPRPNPCPVSHEGAGRHARSPGL